MDLKQFRYFVAIVENGSYSGAARACNISQPSISASVAQLEAELSSQLLERGAFGARPTEFGRLLYGRAKLVLAEMSRTKADLADLNAGNGGHLVIGVSPMTECALFPAIVAEFAQQWAKVQLTVISALSTELFERLAQGELDLVFNSPPRGLVEPPSVALEALDTVPDIVLASVDHPIVRSGDRSLHTLSGYKWIITARASETIQHFFGAFRDAGAPIPEQLVRMDSFPIVARLVADQDYLFVISPMLVPYLARQVSTGRGITAIDIAAFALPRRICVATRRNSVPSRSAQEMIAIIRRHVESQLSMQSDRSSL